MPKTTLTTSSKNYSSWSMRGWLLARFAGLEFEEGMVATDVIDAKAKMLLLPPSILVPRLHHQGVTVWDTPAIAEYLHEIRPTAGLLPPDRAARAHCQAVCGEMHSGFVSLRSALPMNPKGSCPNFKVWSRAQTDITRVLAIWQECLASYGGPFLFGGRGMADAMFAPVVTRLKAYGVAVPGAASRDWCARMLALPEMQEWTAAAPQEPEAIDELEMAC